MPVDIHSDVKSDLTTFECIGKIQFVDLVEAMVKYYEGIGVAQTKMVIWDFSRQESIHLTKYQTSKLADLSLKHAGTIDGVRTAILFPKIVDFDMWELMESRLANASRVLKVCQDKNEAVEWLGVKSDC